MDLIYIGFAAVFIGIIAHVRGRSGIGWFLLTPVLAFGFAVVVYFYMRSKGSGELASMLMLIPFLYGSPVATFLLLIALGRPTPSVERSPASAKAAPVKVDPLAAMTRPAPAPEPDELPSVAEIAGPAVETSAQSNRRGLAAGAVALLMVAAVAFCAIREQRDREARLDHQRTSVAPVASPEPVSMASYIVVPEPSPTAQGELLDQWAGANAPLVPLGK